MANIERYKIDEMLMLKRVRYPEQLYIPRDEETRFALTRDYKDDGGFFYDFLFDCTVSDEVIMALQKRFTWTTCSVIDDEFFKMVAYLDDAGEVVYEFYLHGETVSIEELQDWFYAADDFVPYQDIFDESDDGSESEIWKLMEWFLSMCGCFPYIEKYIQANRGR